MADLKQMQGQAIADAFNELTPIGTDVILINDMGERETTKTRSIAWILGHGEPVVSVEGRSGGYILSRILTGKVD